MQILDSKRRCAYVASSACMFAAAALLAVGCGGTPDAAGGASVGARLTIGPNSGIDSNSPQFKQAENECKQYLPGQGKGLSTSGGKDVGGKAVTGGSGP